MPRLTIVCLVLLVWTTVCPPAAWSADPPKGEPTNAAEAAAKKAADEAKLEADYQAWYDTLTPDQQAWEQVLQENLGGFYLPIHKREKVAGRSNAWDYVEDDPALPRVLLIGDSVSRGYTQAVRKELKGKVNVHRAPENCGPTATGLKKLDIWLGDGKWDLIHFNFGIHDRNTPIADYTQRLQQLVERMQKTGAKLVWATTTPIPDQPDKKQTAASIVERNDAASKVMAEAGVAVDDLFTAITPRLAELQNPNDVHFNGAGYEFLGQQVAQSLLENLPAAETADADDDAQVERVGPWNVTALKSEVPEVKWLDRDKPIHSLTYAGEDFNGHATEVFAFYASPSTIGTGKEGETYPGVVLVHGGGGTAFADWVHLWARRGYAAIAMDLAGSRPPEPVYDEQTGRPVGHQSDGKLRTRLPNGGPNHGHPEKFDSIGGDTSDDWPFHAAANVMRAHSVLRSLPEVQAENTALTGISWGGYTTCLAASLDDRFNAAVPVYGCGFLHEGESVQKPSIDRLGERRADWVREYDPGSLLPRCHVPILFVNGTNDIHYPLDSYMKSYDVVPGPKQLRIVVNMPHGHPSGWAPQEIGLFIDSKCRGGAPLPVPGVPKIEGETVQVSCEAATKLKSVALHYTTDDGLRSKRKWQTVAATIDGNMITAPKPPADANTWFLTVTDERDAVVSTTVQFQ